MGFEKYLQGRVRKKVAQVIVKNKGKRIWVSGSWSWSQVLCLSFQTKRSLTHNIYWLSEPTTMKISFNIVWKQLWTCPCTTHSLHALLPFHCNHHPSLFSMYHHFFGLFFTRLHQFLKYDCIKKYFKNHCKFRQIEWVNYNSTHSDLG